MRVAAAVTLSLITMSAAQAANLASEVNVFIGTTNGGNTYPGATLPFGMVAFSPEEVPLPGRNYPIAAPGGYEWRDNGTKGFSLTHLSGTGCTGASGDIPIMPVTKDVTLSPSADDGFTMYSSYFSHDDEHAAPAAIRESAMAGAILIASPQADSTGLRVAGPVRAKRVMKA